MSSSIFIENPISKPYPTTSNDINASRNIFHSDDHKIYQDVSVVKQLTRAKFPVYLVRSKVNNQNLAMKVFPYEHGKSHPYYQNEIRFSNLQHPNVTQTFYLEHERKTKSKGVISMVSYKIMEFAPYGDLFDFMMKRGQAMDEKLMRTYFKQLIDGLDYLHKNGVSHMDIKLENLLIGNDFVLKIVDFDLSYHKNDHKIISKGTKFYRAPEVLQGRCRNTTAADIYSTGIVLFTLKSHGVLPHAENNLVEGVNFSELLDKNDPKFWTEHCDIQGKEEPFFDDDFRQLFIAMTRSNPAERLTIEEIKQSKWYNAPCYSQEEVKQKLQRILWN